MRMLACLMLTLAAPAAAAGPPPIEVMVLGTYHFGNPGRDVNNARADSVLTAARQRELQVLTETLAEFRPTQVMVEQLSDAPDLADPAFAAFRPEMLTDKPDETVQIGYRLARLAGAPVRAIDEQPAADEPDYFPFDKLMAAAKANNQMALMDAPQTAVQAALQDFERRQPSETIPQLLDTFNDPVSAVAGQAFYYTVLPVGDTRNQAGADLNAMWYLRNAKIFAKLMHAARPGDRLLVVFGSGHGYWLRHFASETPGYRLVDVRPYLARAAERLKVGKTGGNR